MRSVQPLLSSANLINVFEECVVDAVLFLKGIKKGTQHLALWYASVNDQARRKVGIEYKVLDPHAQGVTKT